MDDNSFIEFIEHLDYLSNKSSLSFIRFKSIIQKETTPNPLLIYDLLNHIKQNAESVANIVNLIFNNIKEIREIRDNYEAKLQVEKELEEMY